MDPHHAGNPSVGVLEAGGGQYALVLGRDAALLGAEEAVRAVAARLEAAEVLLAAARHSLRGLRLNDQGRCYGCGRQPAFCHPACTYRSRLALLAAGVENARGAGIRRPPGRPDRRLAVFRAWLLEVLALLDEGDPDGAAEHASRGQKRLARSIDRARARWGRP